jgi:radical SAM superfamily enzyme YgiQ (UPF0313 family)
MAKVLFVQGNYDIDKPKSKCPSMPLALIELASFIKEKGNHKVKIFDRNIYPEEEKFTETLEIFKPDIVGTTCYTSEIIKDVVQLSKIVKEKSRSLFLVGGIHATLEPKSLLDLETIDYIVRGEGELALLEICELLDKKKATKKNILKIKNVNQNPMRGLIDLNELPVPDYDLIEVNKYPIAIFCTSRGCPGRCRFCYNLGRQLRFYNTDKVIKMITGVLEKYKMKEFTIADDNFANLSKRTERICEAISKYNVVFHIFLRADQTHDKVMKNLKKAGCWAIQFGFESGSQKILDFVHKDTSIKQNVNAINQCKKDGIFVDGSFMVGLPTETVEDLKKTAKFIEKYKPNSVDIKTYKPYPSTELFDYCVKNKLIKKSETLKDWIEYCSLKDGIPNVSKIPTKELLKTVNFFSKTSIKIYLKKTFLLLKKGHFKYVLLKLKLVIPQKFKNLRF